MNKLRNNMKYLFLIGTLILLISCSDNYIDVRTLPRPDCSLKVNIYDDFRKDSVQLMVVPDSEDIQVYNNIKSIFRYDLPELKIRFESELTDDDFNKSLYICGDISKFKYWEKYDLPVNKLKNGYSFKNRKYQNKDDGIFYISKNRMVTTGNSLEFIASTITYYVYYQYLIFDDGLLSQYCLADDQVIDIDKIRQSNYNKSSSKYYNLFADKHFPKSTTISDSVVTDICERLELSFPDFTINAFLHDDANAVRLFTNFFPLTGCDTLEKDYLINTVAMNGIHINGLDLEMIKHETFHLLWNTFVGSPGNQSFLNEGIQEYYQQLIDSSRIQRNIEVLKHHADYNIDTLILRGDGNDFWGGPSENNWPIAYNISGLFVKYLIDNWGLDTFKRFYTMTDRENAYKEIYNLTPVELEKGFYKWIEKI